MIMLQCNKNYIILVLNYILKIHKTLKNAFVKVRKNIKRNI